MLEINSTTVKIVIVARFDNSSELGEVAVIGVEGTQIKYVSVLSPTFDDTDDNLGRKILMEESDSRFVDIDTVNMKVINVDVPAMPDMISDEVAEMAQQLPSYDYIIYNQICDDDKMNSTDFFDELTDIITERDCDLEPINFADIFIRSSNIEDILYKYRITDHTYSPQSALSGAIWTSVAFDIGSGYC